MIEKQTVIDQIEIRRDGAVQIRFGLLLLEDGVEIDSKWHRTGVEPGGDLAAQLALVDEHLAVMKKAAIDADDKQRATEIVAAVQKILPPAGKDSMQPPLVQSLDLLLGHRGAVGNPDKAP